MDTDGYVDNEVIFSYCSTSKGLIDDITHLVQSLGGKIESIYEKKEPFYNDKNGEKVICKPAWVIRVKTPFDPFRY